MTGILDVLGDIIVNTMGIDPERIFVGTELTPAIDDKGLWIMLGLQDTDDYGHTSMVVNGEQRQGLSLKSMVSVDMLSNDSSAELRRFDIYGAIYSNYAKNIPGIGLFRGGNIVNLSAIEGPGILNRYRASVVVFHASDIRTERFVGYTRPQIGQITVEGSI